MNKISTLYNKIRTVTSSDSTISYTCQQLFVYSLSWRLPRCSIGLHIWLCRCTRWCHSCPLGCWCWLDDIRSCSPAPPPPAPALLPWQPAASSIRCSTDTNHKRGSDLLSDMVNRQKQHLLVWIRGWRSVTPSLFYCSGFNLNHVPWILLTGTLNLRLWYSIYV